jgi:polysaccharide pyruvyl transferase WcaK-like protein
VLRHAENRTRAMTVAPGVGLVGLLGQGNLGNDGSLEAVLASYAEKMKSFVLWLVDNGRSVRMFTTDVHDERITGEVIAHLRTHRPQLGSSQIVAEPVSSIDELMRQIASVDTVVASRFHNVLCALKLAEPTLSVGYAAKFGVLMEEIGLAEFCQSAHSVDVDRLIEQFTELESRSTQLQQMIMERTAANLRLLNHQFATLSALLFRSAEPKDAAAGHGHTRTDPF